MMIAKKFETPSFLNRINKLSVNLKSSTLCPLKIVKRMTLITIKLDSEEIKMLINFLFCVFKK